MGRKKKGQQLRVGVVKIPKTLPEILRSLYYDPKRPGSFSGLQKFWQATQDSEYAHKIPDKAAVKAWLHTQPTYFLWRPRRVNYPRNKTLSVPAPGFMWAADIWTQPARYLPFNGDFRYVFLALDMFSRFCTCVPMKNKDTVNVNQALTHILSRFTFKVLFTDHDSAITTPKTQALLGKHGVHSLLSKNTLHSYPAERMIQTLAVKLRKAMWTRSSKKWLTLLPQIVKSYNNTKHSALCNGKYSPNEVTFENSAEIYSFLYEKPGEKLRRPRVKRVKPKYSVGDIVVISVNNLDRFRKGYEMRYRFEYFRVKQRDLNQPRPMYKLETLDGSETIQGKFYEEEVQEILISEDSLPKPR